MFSERDLITGQLIPKLNKINQEPIQPLPESIVTSVNAKTGDVVLTKVDVGLSNIDNTSDVNKPVSTAQKVLIDTKLTKPSGYNTGVALGGYFTDDWYVPKWDNKLTGYGVAIGAGAQSSNNAVVIGLCAGTRYVQGMQTVTQSPSSVLIGQFTSGSGIAIGSNAMSGTITTSVAIGSAAAATSDKSAAFGNNAKSNFNNSTALGNSSSVTAANQVQLGNSDTTTYAYGAVQDRSDRRDKTQIHDTDLGLEFINALRPVKFKWDYREDYLKDLFPEINLEDYFLEDAYNQAMSLIAPKSYDDIDLCMTNESIEKQQDFLDISLYYDTDSYLSAISNRESAIKEFYINPIGKDGSKVRDRFHYGLIADELKQICDKFEVDFGGYQDHSINGGLDVKSIGYTELISILIKSVQELSSEIQLLKNGKGDEQ